MSLTPLARREWPGMKKPVSDVLCTGAFTPRWAVSGRVNAPARTLNTSCAGDTKFTTVDLGEVALPAGELTLSVRPLQVVGNELMRLRQLELTPIE